MNMTSFEQKFYAIAVVVLLVAMYIAYLNDKYQRSSQVTKAKLLRMRKTLLALNNENVRLDNKFGVFPTASLDRIANSNFDLFYTDQGADRLQENFALLRRQIGSAVTVNEFLTNYADQSTDN